MSDSDLSDNNYEEFEDNDDASLSSDSGESESKNASISSMELLNPGIDPNSDTNLEDDDDQQMDESVFVDATDGSESDSSSSSTGKLNYKTALLDGFIHCSKELVETAEQKRDVVVNGHTEVKKSPLGFTSIVDHTTCCDPRCMTDAVKSGKYVTDDATENSSVNDNDSVKHSNEKQMDDKNKSPSNLYPPKADSASSKPPPSTGLDPRAFAKFPLKEPHSSGLDPRAYALYPTIKDLSKKSKSKINKPSNDEINLNQMDALVKNDALPSKPPKSSGLDPRAFAMFPTAEDLLKWSNRKNKKVSEPFEASSFETLSNSTDDIDEQPAKTYQQATNTTNKKMKDLTISEPTMIFTADPMDISNAPKLNSELAALKEARLRVFKSFATTKPCSDISALTVINQIITNMQGFDDFHTFLNQVSLSDEAKPCSSKDEVDKQCSSTVSLERIISNSRNSYEKEVNPVEGEAAALPKPMSLLNLSDPPQLPQSSQQQQNSKFSVVTGPSFSFLPTTSPTKPSKEDNLVAAKKQQLEAVCSEFNKAAMNDKSNMQEYIRFDEHESHGKMFSDNDKNNVDDTLKSIFASSFNQMEEFEELCENLLKDSNIKEKDAKTWASNSFLFEPQSQKSHTAKIEEAMPKVTTSTSETSNIFSATNKKNQIKHATDSCFFTASDSNTFEQQKNNPSQPPTYEECCKRGIEKITPPILNFLQAKIQKTAEPDFKELKESESNLRKVTVTESGTYGWRTSATSIFGILCENSTDTVNIYDERYGVEIFQLKSEICKLKLALENSENSSIIASKEATAKYQQLQQHFQDTENSRKTLIELNERLSAENKCLKDAEKDIKQMEIVMNDTIKYHVKEMKQQNTKMIELEMEDERKRQIIEKNDQAISEAYRQIFRLKKLLTDEERIVFEKNGAVIKADLKAKFEDLKKQKEILRSNQEIFEEKNAKKREEIFSKLNKLSQKKLKHESQEVQNVKEKDLKLQENIEIDAHKVQHKLLQIQAKQMAQKELKAAAEPVAPVLKQQHQPLPIVDSMYLMKSFKAASQRISFPSQQNSFHFDQQQRQPSLPPPAPTDIILNTKKITSEAASQKIALTPQQLDFHKYNLEAQQKYSKIIQQVEKNQKLISEWIKNGTIKASKVQAGIDKAKANGKSLSPEALQK
uniref:Uncharacterized protein n=1 Tax=Panagrolaimus superbus TaxID=310955 RepID=A0A914YY64_9BILA